MPSKLSNHHWHSDRDVKTLVFDCYHSPLPAPAKPLTTKTATKTTAHKMMTKIRGKTASFIFIAMRLICASESPDGSHQRYEETPVRWRSPVNQRAYVTWRPCWQGRRSRLWQCMDIEISVCRFSTDLHEVLTFAGKEHTVYTWKVSHIQSCTPLCITVCGMIRPHILLSLFISSTLNECADAIAPTSLAAP